MAITAHDIANAAQIASAMDQFVLYRAKNFLGYMRCPGCGEMNLCVWSGGSCGCICGHQTNAITAFAAIGITLEEKKADTAVSNASERRQARAEQEFRIASTGDHPLNRNTRKDPRRIRFRH